MNNILVTGSTGLVGSAVVRKLKSLNSLNILTPTHKELDLLNSSTVNDYIMTHTIDYIIHCAGSVAGIIGNSKDNYGQMYKNLIMGLNVIESFRNRSDKFNTNKLLFLGSTCIYPRNASQPIKEDSLLTSSLESTNEGYALAKISCIKLCEYLNKSNKYKGKFISCMPTNVYGINDSYDPIKSHVFPALIKKIVDAKYDNLNIVKLGGTGTPIRSFICSDDLADALIFLLKNYSGSEHINIGRSEGISIKDLAIKIAKIINYTGKFVMDPSIPDGTPIKIEDNNKLLSLGWYPKISLDDGIKLVISDYIKYRRTHDKC